MSSQVQTSASQKDMPEKSEEKARNFSFGIKVEDIIARGLCFGHERGKLYPKMAPFVAGIRRNVYILDPYKIAERLEEALKQLQEIRNSGGTILLVDTKVEHESYTKEVALELGLPYVISRWLGGTFTNFKVMRERVKVMEELERKLQDEDELKKYTKKEINKMRRELEKMKEKFEGIRSMTELPQAVLILSLAKDTLPAIEARKVGIKSYGVADSNANPELVDFVIPGNDDAPSATLYILEKLKTALTENSTQ